MQTILAATDFSTNAELATERAVAIASRHRARVVLAHAFAPLATSRVDLSVLPPSFEADVAKTCLQRLEKQAADMRRDGVEVTTHIQRGAPADTILEIARDEGADLVVAGTRGSAGFEHALLGSVAESIVESATCPVLVVHENDVPMLDPPARVLVPTDRSDDVDHVVEALAATFGVEGPGGQPIEIVLAHSDRLPPMLFATLEGLSGVDLLPFGQVAPELTRLLEPTADRLRERGFAASIAIRDGEAAGELIRTAGDRNVDLIALSTRGRRGVARLLLGSTARRVVQHAPCPVLTVRQPEA